MNHQKLLFLFLCKLVLYVAGAGLLSLLPVYATQLGASPEFIGYYLSSIYLCLSGGTFLAGWFSNRWRRYQYFLCGGAIGFSLALFLMSQSQTLWQLTSFTAFAWFCSGFVLSSVNSIAGLSTEQGDRGRIFSVLETVQGLGSLIGGLTLGRLADQWGYPTMILIVTGVSLLCLVCGCFVQDPVVTQDKPIPISHLSRFQILTQDFQSFNLAFYSVLLISFFAILIQPIDALTRPLLMDSLKFDATAISSMAATVAVSIPLLPVIGWLCDRTRQPHWMLMLCCLIGTLGMLTTAVANTFWQFWWTAVLVNISFPFIVAIGNTMILDLIPKQSVAIALSVFNSVIWLTAVIGFTATGYFIQWFGMKQTFALSALLPLIVCLLLPYCYGTKEVIDKS